MRRLRAELGPTTPRDRHRRAGRAARAVHPRDDRRGRRPAHADRAAADLGAESPMPTRRPAGSARQASAPRVAARIRNAIRRRVVGCSAGVLLVVVEQRANRGEHRRVVDLVGDVAGEPRQRQHLGPASMPRIVAIAPNSRNKATRSSSTCGARSRSPIGRPGRLQRLAGGDPQRLLGGDRADLLGREPELEAPSGAGTRPRSAVCAVRSVGGEQDLPGRHEREQRLEVGRHPPRGVEQQVRVVGRRRARSTTGRRSRRGRGSAARSGTPRPARRRAGRAPGSRGRRGSAPAASARSASATSARTVGMVERELPRRAGEA